MNDLKFTGKLIIKFNLRCLTGLHIGGTVEGIEIGGIDNPVIKDPLTGIPYIPGSSLKGKLRSLLEWELGKVYRDKYDKAPPHTCENDPEIVKLREEISRETDKSKQEGKKKEYLDKLKDKIAECPVCRIFGISASAEFGEPTRLTVRDAYPTEDTINMWENVLGANTYTELKTENAIDRITSMANPRPLERVPKDSKFEVEMVYDIYRSDDLEFLKYLFMAMALLEDSSLGGSGSRGSGKIKFEQPALLLRSKDYYIGAHSKEKVVKLDDILKALEKTGSLPKLLYDRFEEIAKGIRKDENISGNPQA